MKKTIKNRKNIKNMQNRIQSQKIQKTTENLNKMLTTKTMKKLNCSPDPDKKKKSYSCLKDETLIKLRNLWNARHPDAKIKTNKPKLVWVQLKKYLAGSCNKESCWLKQKFVEGKLQNELKESFAPVSPKEWKKNPNEWLSSVDIINVMKQYEKAYTCFEFMGPSPIDYDTVKLYGECVWEELCHFKLENQIKKGKTKIGIIFNTDPHYKGGSHWISLFINIKKGVIYFFDSVGEKAPERVMKFVNMVTEQGKQLEKPILFQFDQNYPVEHQYGNTECGIYSLYFIIHMLQDKINGHYLKTHILKDEYMQKFRNVYFNQEL
jgi:hypothetical protein